MAEGGQDFKALSEAECPICKVEVTSIRILTCSHGFCDACLAKLTEKTESFPCPVCREVCSKPEEAIRKYFGEIKCPLCLKSKDVDEFFWCVECQDLICCRCITKDHGFEHELLEWSTKNAYAACFKALSNSKNFGRNQLAKAIELLLKPIILQAADSIGKSSAAHKDVGRFLAQTYGLNIKGIGNGNRVERGPNTPKLMRTLADLAGVDLPIEPIQIGTPSRVRNPERLLNILMDELELAQDPLDLTADKYTQTLDKPQKETNAINPSTPSAQASEKKKRNMFSSTFRKKNSYISATKDSLKIGPFNQTQKTDFVVGPTNSYAVMVDGKVLFFLKDEKSEKDWMVQCITSIHPTTKIVSVALDGIGGIHLVGLHEGKVYYFHGSSSGATYSFEIDLDPDIKEKVNNAVVFSTVTGVPFLFVVSKKEANYYSILYKFGSSKSGGEFKNYEFATFAARISDSYIRSASVIRGGKTWILGADNTSINIMLQYKTVAGSFELIRQIPINSPWLCSFGTLQDTAIIRRACSGSNSEPEALHRLKPIETGEICKFFFPSRQIDIFAIGYQKTDLKMFSFSSDGFFKELS